jgi:hypothetical protein
LVVAKRLFFERLFAFTYHAAISLPAGKEQLISLMLLRAAQFALGGTNPMYKQALVAYAQVRIVI